MPDNYNKYLIIIYQFIVSRRERIKITHNIKMSYTKNRIRKILELSDFKIKKCLFVDCGSNLGQGFDFFKEIFQNEYFDYVMIEPNPNCISYLQNKYVDLVTSSKLKIIPKAASISESETLLFGLIDGKSNMFSQGASIETFHNSAEYIVDKGQAIYVKTFDFVTFLKDCSKSYELIFVKMDIEGAEYSIIEEILNVGLEVKINGFMVEFHSEYMESGLKKQYRKKEKEFLRLLRKSGCQVFTWI